eukprot:TRINITY_DN109_c2_g1_i1.p1 TRINITY_DN109_c2_g1~~TRINITY_DN109_c2_g1_i1.p1  ORF type:complete len:531 (+),score=135.70 TRINITY_DN109_c2_g1_i1:44-1636(+)
MLSLAAIAGCALSGIHEKVTLPSDWVPKRIVAPGEELDFLFAVKHTQESKKWLLNTVTEVSNPFHEKYGSYITLEELNAKMAPPASRINNIVSALEGPSSQVEVLPSGDFIRLHTNAGVASNLFNTHFCEYSHIAGATNITRACSPQYHVPDSIQNDIDVVSGLVHFPVLSDVKVGSKADSGDIATLRATYATEGVKPSGKTSVCFTQFLEQWYSPDDLQAFEKKYCSEQVGQTITKKVGPWKSGTGTEAELDAQYIVGMGAGVDTWVWSNVNKNKVNNQEPWMEFFANVSSATEVPNLFSISYGEGENTLTQDYTDRSDVELQKIAARGITIMSASGDNGAGCKDDKFIANFPAALPHITSVGGTANCQKGAEAASFSSGGFSDMYGQTAWQKDAVEKYLSTASLPKASYFNRTGRAYPDVAACGSVEICTDHFCGLPVEGTSCASPIFAGVMGLVNDARVAASKPPLGFLSPALYAAYGKDATSFNDVIKGSTAGCGLEHWSAVAGWDPTTGLGTPNYPNLLKQLMQF